MSEKQKQILAFVLEHGSINLDDAYCYFGGGYYTNGRKHIGAALSRMVKAGLLVRTQRGCYELPEPKTIDDLKAEREQPCTQQPTTLELKSE